MNCPFLNSDNPHCSEHLNMNKLDEAFNLCTNHYMMCPIYMEISQDELEVVAVGAENAQGQSK